MRRVVGTAVLVGITALTTATAIRLTANERGVAVRASGSDCTKETSMPDSGRFELQFLQPSTQNPDRNDYRLISTMTWNDPRALSCFSAGRIDWAYEHEIRYGSHFDRKIWGENFSELPANSGAYIDNTASDVGNTTTLSFGIFRPERLTTGVTYRVSYDVLLPNAPANGSHRIAVGGDIADKQCSDEGPWCVGLNPLAHHTQTFIGPERGFMVGGDCWSWTQGQEPVRCGTATTAPTHPAATQPPETAPPETQAPTTSPPAPQPRLAQPPVTIPPTQPPVTQPPPTRPPTTSPAPAGPTARDLVVVVYGGGHVGVAFEVGWRAGRDPVTCHFLIDGAEVFTAQCGTHASKQFYGVGAGAHSFEAFVTDREGIRSNRLGPLVRNVT
jgi:hypothetical protein